MDLRIENLGKQYTSTFWGLRKFTLHLQPGVVGLLGPNGAGKSTLMRMLATVMRPTEGSLHWNDTDVLKAPDGLRRVLGYLPQDFGVYPNLNVLEFLEYMAAAKGLSRGVARRRIDELIVLVNLQDARKRALGGFSGGMRQRAGIAQALLNDPELLIVDEPTAGLDPEERVRFRNLLSELSGDRIILLSTHIVSDIEAIATRIALINRGRLVVEDAPEALMQRIEGRVWEWRVLTSALRDIKDRFLVSSAVRRSDGVQVRAVCDEAPTPEARAVSATLEDVYLHTIAQSRQAAA